MTSKRWTAAAALAFFAPFAAHAATEANFGAKTTGDLAGCGKNRLTERFVGLQCEMLA